MSDTPAIRGEAVSAGALPMHARPTPGLRFEVARTAEDVIEAWRLVYRSHLVSGYIHPNPANVHFPPQAVGPNTAVILGRIDALIVSTMTVIADSACHGHPARAEGIGATSEHSRDGRGTPARGLPLDRVFGIELAKLRASGARLVEFGLFADRRKHVERTLDAVFQHMAYVLRFAEMHGATDVVVGLHPDHAHFFTRGYGFELQGPTTPDPSLKHHPIMLLRRPLTADLAVARRQFPALDYALTGDVPTDVFFHRFAFERGHIAGTELDQRVL